MSPIPDLATVFDIDGQTFDFVIIGGGIAGCVLANRLSEDPNVSVAMLEAGKSRLDDPVVSSPVGYLQELMNPEYDWLFPIAPQPNASTAHMIPWNRGKMLGGSSAINVMAYTKPAREELDALETLGNPGWNWSSYQKYANKAEGFRTPAPAIMDEDFRNLYNPDSVGHDGNLTLSFVPTGSNADSAFQKSLANNGLDIRSDALGGEITGIAKTLSTLDPKTGYRVSAATAYLLPALGRPNLKILTEAYACRIVTETEAGGIVARAVEFEHGGKQYTASAAREVIVSAGTVKTPQILELSGIGDPKVLEPLGIKAVLDLPSVGTNVQEHIVVANLNYRMQDDRNIVTNHILADKEYMAEVHKRLGLQTEYALLANNFAFVPLHVASPNAAALIARKRAELAQRAPTLPPGLRKQYEVQLELMASGRNADIEMMSSAVVLTPMAEPAKPHMALVAELTHPWSRGTIHVASADPKAHPHIDPRFLSDAFDLDVLAEGFKFALKVGETEPFRGMTKARVGPPPEVDLSTDEGIRDYVRANIFVTWHACGAASMLPKDLGGVVDPQLRVYGTTNIRVVDLSVLPLQLSVHSQAFVYALAEQAADIIKGIPM
ncbi:uncharacterized protein PHACADRAFT_262829 [Phanerochaete carnosa HHB-10118-sp]|uniref:Glucose-methanol-choline oxidoreductase N-terminal domain-containing protein n=1 Tax=Phanerochaete carnosa (strain HHB-10118-sp) TaxID=650164 RepID=K5VI50_PHACS|nr:uncharacterized protein PHACADRAFT_262829 [Phanerochaete carnosa HHB-10118-sp]EKM50933.1 hypothetical protein PHACADRAFT_262829 [Phanerochaete carnosa HHB-10118-sp]